MSRLESLDNLNDQVGWWAGGLKVVDSGSAWTVTLYKSWMCR